MSLFFDEENIGMIIKIFLTLVMLVTGWLGYLFVPDILEARRAAVKSSSGYIEAKQSKLLKLSQEYNDCTLKINQLKLADTEYVDLIEDYKAQRGALLEAIRMESIRIPDEELPETVLKILRSR